MGVSKLQELLSSEQVRWILGAGPDAVDVRAAMDDGTSLLVDLGRTGSASPRAVRSRRRTCSSTGPHSPSGPAAIVRTCSSSTRHTSSRTGPLPKLLAEARKFGVAVVVATQHLGQLTGELADALESNTGSVHRTPLRPSGRPEGLRAP